MYTFRLLAEVPKCIPQLAAWHQDQWGYLNPSNSVEKRIECFNEELKSDRYFTFVAVEDGHPVGSASLVDSDMNTHPEWCPWLASVSHRNRGIGSTLVLAVMDEARRRGDGRLYLFTPDQRKLYERLGWQHISREFHAEEEVDVMDFYIPQYDTTIPKT
jgi:predicted N-acetyltransferase YhbS